MKRITMEEAQEKYGDKDIDYFCVKCEHPPSYCICDGSKCNIEGCCEEARE